MMFQFVETFDRAPVEALASDPRIRPYMTHDGVEGPVSFLALFENPSTFFLRVDFEGTPCGGFLFVGQEVHTMLLPPLRGQLAIDAGKAACDWLRVHRGWETMTSQCYSCHPQTLFFAKRVGFRRINTVDQHIFVNRKPVLTHLLEYRF